MSPNILPACEDVRQEARVIHIVSVRPIATRAPVPGAEKICRSLFEDQFSRGQGELLNHFAIRREEFEILRIGMARAHSASLYQTWFDSAGKPSPEWACFYPTSAITTSLDLQLY
jgi:hypothetical protein